MCSGHSGATYKDCLISGSVKWAVFGFQWGIVCMTLCPQTPWGPGHYSKKADCEMFDKGKKKKKNFLVNWNICWVWGRCGPSSPPTVKTLPGMWRLGSRWLKMPPYEGSLIYAVWKARQYDNIWNVNKSSHLVWLFVPLMQLPKVICLLGAFNLEPHIWGADVVFHIIHKKAVARENIEQRHCSRL